MKKMFAWIKANKALVVTAGAIAAVAVPGAGQVIDAVTNAAVIIGEYVQ